MTAPNYSGLSFIVRFFFALWFPAAAVAQMTTTTTSSSHVLHIPGASKTLTAPILHAKGYVGLAHPTKVLATDAPWNERQDCEYGFHLYCTNEAFCDAGSYKTVWQGPKRYEGLGSTLGASYTEFCSLYGMTSAHCVKVTSPIRSSWSYSSTTYFPTTTTYTLSNPTGLDFGQVPITGVGYGKGGPLNGHDYFLSHFKSCLGSFAMPTAVSPDKNPSPESHEATRVPLEAAMGIGVGVGVVCFIVLALVSRVTRSCRQSRTQPGRRANDKSTGCLDLC